jgi:hypothetical protein
MRQQVELNDVQEEVADRDGEYQDESDHPGGVRGPGGLRSLRVLGLLWVDGAHWRGTVTPGRASLSGSAHQRLAPESVVSSHLGERSAQPASLSAPAVEPETLRGLWAVCPFGALALPLPGELLESQLAILAQPYL